MGRLSGGLEKLIQAAVEVDAMQKELSVAKVEVEAATLKCNELLEVIVENTAEVGSEATAAGEKEAALVVESQHIAVEKAEAEQVITQQGKGGRREDGLLGRCHT